MERNQSLYWHVVAHDLSESGVLPMTIRDLLGPGARTREAFLATALGYPLSEGVARVARGDRATGTRAPRRPTSR